MTQIAKSPARALHAIRRHQLRFPMVAITRMVDAIALRNTWFYFFWNYQKLKKAFLSSLSEEGSSMRTVQMSKAEYDAADDGDQVSYEVGKVILCMRDGKVTRLPFSAIRDIYFETLTDEINELVTTHAPLKILEVGCGNCINLVLLRKRYEGDVVLSGYDISSERIRNATEYYKQDLDGVELFVHSATERLDDFADNSFDVVFSVHALEQLTYDNEVAITEMYRLARYLVIMLEPIYELGNRTQKLYMHHIDYNRSLLSKLREHGWSLKTVEKTRAQMNPLNPAGLIVIQKENTEPLASESKAR